MAAACNVTEDASSSSLTDDLLEAQIVAQAITELQEIHAPVVQSGSSQTDDVYTVATVDSHSDTGQIDTSGIPQTQVIYYIEDGTIARTEDRTLVDSSVQANDYEIERRSGKLPARRRVIPIKFRDYKNTSDDENSDSDYDPYENIRRKVPKRPKPISEEKTMGTNTGMPETPTFAVNKQPRVGRPRKHFMPIQSVTSSTVPLMNPEVSDEIEQKYQEALKISMETALEKSKEAIVEKLTDNKMVEENILTEKTAEGTNNVAKDDTEKGLSPGLADMMVGHKRGRGRPRGPTWEKYYKCPDCSKTFNQKGNLRVHLRVHTKQRPFPCQEDNCGKSFRSNESLRRHLLSHQGIKPFECDICANKFSSNVALTEHRSRHYDQKPHECQHCQRRFRQVSCLRRHISTHSTDLPYVCTLCQRRFAQSAYLKSHMKVHTGEKPFQCEHCNKRFAHQSDVKRHRTTHTGEKPYSCGKCQARFSDVSSKNRHEKEHETSKRYTCHLCNDTFKRTGQLRSHLNRKHSHTFAVKIEKDPNSGAFTFKMGEDGDPNSVHVTQQRIVSLIKNLHSKTVTEGFTEINNISLVNIPPAVNQTEETVMATDHVTDISQLEKEVDPSVIENDMGVPIELQGVEIQGEDNGQTYIAITDLADAWAGVEKGDGDGQVENRYRIIYEITEDGQQKQILVPYNPADEGDHLQLEYSDVVEGQTDGEIVETIETIEAEIADSHGESIVTNTDVEDSTAITEPVEQSETIGLLQETQTEIESTMHITTGIGENVMETHNGGMHSENTAMEVHELSIDADGKTDSEVLPAIEKEKDTLDYVANPDFSSQEYYNWLTNFTELCKVVPMPLDMSLFQKISQVHKTLSDVMATPSGVIADRENFTVLMNISKELSTIINEHLVFVLENLNSEEKEKQHTENLDMK